MHHRFVHRSPQNREILSRRCNLAEGQKGVLWSGYFKLLVPFLMMVPGVIAFHLYQGKSLPSFDSLLNSAATLFCLDIYAPFKKDKVSDAQLIKVAKIASVVIALFSFVVAPLLMFAPEGLWQIIRIFTGFYNIPVITIVLVGFFTSHVPAIAAKAVIIFH